MDRRSAKRLKLFSAVGLLLIAGAVTAAGKPLLQAMAWLAPETHIAALSIEPVTLNTIPSGPDIDTADAEDWNSHFRQGEALFRSPALLGGQAAKAGLSCNSCHVNGRGNRHFLFPGISGRAGTADVSNSFFSAKRHNGKFDPAVIPDLTSPGKLSRDSMSSDLENFIRDLIVEEFDGSEPGEEILNALADYVRNIKAPTDGPQNRPVTLKSHLENIDDALSSAQWDGVASSERGLHILIAAARHQLSGIHERFAGRKLRKQRQVLTKFAYRLGDIQKQSRSDRRLARNMIGNWRQDFHEAWPMLIRAETRSLYNQAKLEKALSRD
ncbi:MAG: hypothetical protein V3V15_00425 [Sphingorhabdus sp.]